MKSQDQDHTAQVLTDVGERSFIERIRGVLPTCDNVIVGIGDDCAVVRPSADSPIDLVLTSDAVIESIHFLPGTDPQAVGHKAVSRMLSDIAAMGAAPLWALVDLVAPADLPLSQLDRIYESMARTAGRYGLSVAGGDTSAGKELALHMFGVGQVPTGTALLRSGANAGDVIFVTGSLGDGMLKNRHLDFEPRLENGRWLREHNWATALIDVSDGLATDLGHLTSQSKTGALVRERAIPVSAAAMESSDNRSPVEHALFDGEDYELLFCVQPSKADSFTNAWQKEFDLPVAAVGVMTDQPGSLQMERNDGPITELSPDGYEHFGEQVPPNP